MRLEDYGIHLLNALHNLLVPFLPNLCQLYHHVLQGIGRGRVDVEAFLLHEAKNNIETKYYLTPIALARIISNHF